MIGLLSQLGSLASLAAPASDPQSAFRPRPLSTPAPTLGADTASYDAAYADWLGSIMSGVDQSFGGFSGVADQLLGRPAQLNQPTSYYDALSGGGTAAQNARFERMYDPRWAQQSATQSLAADPQFGHLFGGGNASVTQFNPAAQSIPQITNDSIWAAMNATDEANANRFDSRYGRPATGDELAAMGQTSGVSLSPELQSQALERRLAQRAESQANLNAMRMTPMDYVDPLKRMQAAYDWQVQQDSLAQQAWKNQLAQLAMQAEIDARNLGMQQEASQFDRSMDFKELQARLSGQANQALAAQEQRNWQADHDLEKLKVDAALEEAKRAGRLSPEAYVTMKMGDGSQYATPEERSAAATQILREYDAYMRGDLGGGPLGFLGGLFGEAGDMLGGMFSGGAATTSADRRPTAAVLEGLKGLSPEQQVIYLRDNGWTDDQILDRLKDTQPNRYGISLDYPTGSSGFYEAMKLNPMYPMWLDDTWLGGAIQETLMPGYDSDKARMEFRGRKPTAPSAPAAPSSMPALQFFPPVSAF